MTSYYKNKSELYLYTASDLMDSPKCQFSVVPHTAYYSCLLLMQHKCYIIDKKTETEIRPIVHDKQVNLHVGLTNYIKEKIGQSKGCNADEDLRDFTSKIRDLKLLRVKADYENKDITYDDSRKSVELANDIINILKRN